MNEPKQRFCHLHVHTQYSLLDGAARIPELVERAKALGQDAIAITDHGSMYGVIDFYKACKKAGVKPILGMETYVARHSLLDRDGTRERDGAHLILLAKDQTGYENLMYLSSEAFIHGYYYRPRIDYDLLEKHAKGLVCLSACLAGDIPQALLQGRDDDARALAKRLKGMFGEDFYIELQYHGIPEQKTVLPKLRVLARALSIRTVATNDVHYVNRDDAEAQDVLLCIQTQRFQDEPDRMRMHSDDFYLKSAEELHRMLPDDPDAFDATAEIADKCNVEIVFGVRRLPHFTAPDGMDNEAYLRRLCDEGFARKIPQADESYRARLEYELGVITRMGFIDYYLIVWDFIHYARTQDIVVGPGRGSGAASIAAYCLGITDVDPIRYNLLFERFLNPERVSMPDFDVDFCFERRQEVIDYVARKYGEGHVAQIITFGSLKARAVLRDVARVMRLPYADADRLAKLVPHELDMTLDKALQVSTEFKALYDSDETVKKVVDLSRKLENLPRHSGTHAAGVVISGVPLTGLVPLQKNDEAITTQFPMGTLEELGLLKMDFLGLRTLTVIRDALAFIREGGKEPPALEGMQYDDPAVFSMIAAADTDGVFQLESAGMRQFMQQLRPDCFEDLIAGISLFRPGPMNEIPRYVKGKHDPSSISYAHPLLEPILKTTYGCMVYQEQVMQIVRALAGYSFGRSDLVRRAMSKKKPEVLAAEREAFIYGTDAVPGAVKNGVPAPVANQIFDDMMYFAGYAFNKAHAAAYAVLAYRTAYLKLYYPVELLTATINSFMGSIDEVARYVYAAKRLGVDVLPPDVNRSVARFSVENGRIRFGLAAVKNVGGAAMEMMVRERQARGPFRDFFDFCDRSEGLNKRMLEALISAGCFDSMGANRAQLLAVCEPTFDSSAAARKTRDAGQLSLFDMGGAQEALMDARPALPNVPELTKQALLARERESTGLYLSGHPLDHFAKLMESLSCTVQELAEADGVTGVSDNAAVRVAGLLTQCKQKPTKSGAGLMGYAVLEGVTGRVEAVLFPRTLQQCLSCFRNDATVLVRGRLNIREERDNSLLIEELSPLTNDASLRLFLRFPQLTEQAQRRAAAFLSKFPGSTPVVLFDAETRSAKSVPENMFINPTEAALAEAERAFGKENVKLQ